MGRYTDRNVNRTPRAKTIKNKLEEYGHKNVEVWWEPIRQGAEMSGYEGGWFFCSNWVDENNEEFDYFEPIGYNIEEALEYIEDFDLREDN